MPEEIQQKSNKSIIAVLLILNIFVIFTKELFADSSRCSACNTIPLIGISNHTLAALGITANIMLLILTSLIDKKIGLYTALILSLAFSLFSIFMQIARYYIIVDQRFCMYCLTTTVIFIVVFLLVLHRVRYCSRKNSSKSDQTYVEMERLED